MFEMIADAADGALASLRTAGIAAVRTVNVERRWPEPWLSSLCMPQSTIHETRRDELSLLGESCGPPSRGRTALAPELRLPA